MSSATLEIELRDTLDYIRSRLTWKEIYVDFRKIKSWQGLILWLDIERGYADLPPISTPMIWCISKICPWSNVVRWTEIRGLHTNAYVSFRYAFWHDRCLLPYMGTELPSCTEDSPSEKATSVTVLLGRFDQCRAASGSDNQKLMSTASVNE
jgi:hypothetical protein